DLQAPRDGEKGVPKDCSVLVIARPQKDASGDELEAIRSYLEKGGKLLLLADFIDQSSLMTLVKEYGISFDTEPYVLIDLAKYDGFEGPTSIVANDNFSSDHDVTKSLRDPNGGCVFSLARRLEVSGATAGATVTKLVSTTDKSIAKKVVDGKI